MYKNIYVVINNYDFQNIPFKAKNIYCLSDYLNFINKGNKFNIITPNSKETSINAKNLLVKENELSNLIIEETSTIKKNCEINSFEELLRPFLNPKLSSYFYLRTTLPNSDEYFIFYGKKWLNFSSKERTIIEIEKRLSKFKNSAHFHLKEATIIKNNIIDKLAGYIQAELLKINLKKSKNLFLLMDKDTYFFKEVTKMLQRKNRNILYHYSISKKFKYFYSLIRLFISIFLKKNIYTSLFLVSKNFSSDLIYENKIK